MFQFLIKQTLNIYIYIYIYTYSFSGHSLEIYHSQLLSVAFILVLIPTTKIDQTNGSKQK